MPSLSVNYENGKVLINCQASCDTDDILASVGLTWPDLIIEKHVVATYPYTEVDGTLRYEVQRYEPKTFRQRRPDPDRRRKWINNMQGVEPLLFNLPAVTQALAAGEDVYIVEGEKDVLVMDSAYLAVATCNHGGAGKWEPEHSAPFKDSNSRVVIIADRDSAGYTHALSVMASLREVAGIKAQLALPHAGKDATEHVQANQGRDSFVPSSPANMRALLVEAKRAEEIKRKSASKGTNSSVDTRISSAPGKLILRAASDIVSRRQKFLWQDRIPLGTLTLFGGRGGVGKSAFAIWLAVEAQHGRLLGDLHGEPIAVLYVSIEDNWSTQMVPRLVASGAELSAFYELSIGFETDDETGERVPSLPEDTHLIREAIEQTGAMLVILDPITSTMTGDDHKRDVVRSVLDPLARVASETDVVIIGIMHFNKGVGNASDKLSGSHAYRDAARAVMLFARDEDDDLVVMSQDKGNYARYGDKSLAYRLVDTPVDLDDGEVGHVARVEIIGETDTSVSQIINRPQGESNDAAEWLTEFMREMSGRAPADLGLTTGQAEGFTKNQINRARKKARPRVDSRKTGMSGGWEWVTEEITRAEEIPMKSEEITFLHPDVFVTPSGERAFTRPYKATSSDRA